MAYSINHVHIRSSDPHQSVAWFEEHFGAKLVSEGVITPGTVTIVMGVDGPARLLISSKPDGTSDDRASAELFRLGLEHFGFQTDDLAADLERLQKAGIRVVQPLTEVRSGAKIAFIEGPDDVLIELVQGP